MLLPASIPPFILASASPRRKELLEQTGLKFTIVKVDVDETENKALEPLEIVDDLALRKLAACHDYLKNNLVITADTLVFIDNDILAKPLDRREAHAMLSRLSGADHTVTTSVCLGYQDKIRQFNVSTTVHFESLSDEIINYYIDTYQPFDKAGSYGIQEWLGQIGISSISGSYTNVVGLPVAETYAAIIEVIGDWQIIK